MNPAWSRALVLAFVVLACAAQRPGEGTGPAIRDSYLPRLASTEELASWIQAGPVNLVDIRSDVVTYLKD
ncbi:MAG TPA: hypothetical protein VFZ87_04425, partial [Gemmatimonadales bacterium]